MLGGRLLPWAVAALGIFLIVEDSLAWTHEEVLQGIQKRYSEIRDLRAWFHQTTSMPMMNRVREAGGRIYLKLPGRMRWDYLEGRRKTVIIRDQTLWFYDQDERQLTVTDLTKVPQSSKLLSFLTGVGDLQKEFLVVKAEPVKETRDGYLAVRLEPKEENAQWTYLVLVVDPKDFHVVETSFQGIQGERTEIRYSQVETNVGLSDDLFRLEVPPDTEVLHYPPPETSP
jgi:outer membrane lipoprotein carrier protein